jgi:CBS domain-containing protein/mannitol/fructose-specific phosphotransferase system IIA component (Ntr-type)
MQFIDLLPREHIAVPLEGSTLAEAMSALVARLAAAGAVEEPAAIEQWLAARRPGEVVNLVAGVALPHYRTDQVARLTVALGVAPRLLGGTPEARIVALILAPTEAATLYLQTVAALARLFRDESVAQAMLAARTPDDILAIPQLVELRLAPRLTVRDIMIHTLDGVPPELGVRDAVDLMIRKRLRAMPVVGEKREVLGIISEWDVMRGLLPLIPRAGEDEKTRDEASPLTVRDVMTRSVLCVSEDMALEEAAHLMMNKDVEQFPVVREGKLTGFLTRGDIIRKLFGR